ARAGRRDRPLRALSARDPAASVVTGAAGFIGRALTRRLAGPGRPVIAIDRVAWNAPDGVAAHVVNDDAGLAAILAGVRVGGVFALAGGRMAQGGLAAHLIVNLVPLAGLLEAVAPAEGVRVVFASSGEVYGSAPAPFDESAPAVPRTPYGLAKLACEELGLSWARSGAGRFAVARLAVVYGPGQRGDMFVPSLVRALARGERFEMSPGEQIRDFVYVDDVVDALLALAATDAASGACWNVGSGSGVRLDQVAALACAAHAELAGTAGAADVVRGARAYRPNEVMDYRFDSSRFRALTGWSARVPLAQGLRRTLEWAMMEPSGRAAGGAPAPAGESATPSPEPPMTDVRTRDPR
ncbi:MAG TPA: NAD(P)-dependent oxidoreductase, partial [Candidatus Eisenbacteria bacterium]|nr:NAD(P)-dependent oxidoreductase [Candidatus Eisenbacteria bacterium]